MPTLRYQQLQLYRERRDRELQERFERGRREDQERALAAGAKDEFTLAEVGQLADERFQLFAGSTNKDRSLAEAKHFKAEHGGWLYTQVDTEQGPRYLKGEHVVNRTGVYGVFTEGR